ncbi:hypothetical protein MKZ38_009755 [Zalerion maritima]|uniref:Rhodopsin domain-containing protein n=1 Tax=Zalerion maritima TaxID=339359 RepID=A0AAD5RU84_9PEZI|nr:hypothetical protein MKZ38_009755 [Zalerion maritima]
MANEVLDFGGVIIFSLSAGVRQLGVRQASLRHNSRELGQDEEYCQRCWPAPILAALLSKTCFALFLTLLRIADGWLKILVLFIIATMAIVMGGSAVLVWLRVDIEIRIFTFTITTSYSGAMGIIFAFLPWNIIWSLFMSRKEKLGVAFAMSIGVFAGAASIVKVFYVESLRSTDPTDSVTLVTFGAAESAITIIAASILILRTLIRDPAPKMPQFCHLDQWHEDDANQKNYE